MAVTQQLLVAILLLCQAPAKLLMFGESDCRFWFSAVQILLIKVSTLLHILCTAKLQYPVLCIQLSPNAQQQAMTWDVLVLGTKDFAWSVLSEGTCQHACYKAKRCTCQQHLYAAASFCIALSVKSVSGYSYTKWSNRDRQQAQGMVLPIELVAWAGLNLHINRRTVAAH